MSKPLKGWEEIRQALLFVEGLCIFSKHTLAGVEIYQKSEVTTTRVFLRTLDELDSYLAPIFERIELNIALEFKQSPDGLDIFREVYGRIVLNEEESL